MKKLLSILFIAAILASYILCVPSNAAYNDYLNKTTYSECLFLMSSDNNEVIFDKNAGMQTAPASLTKIVTAIVVLENCPDLNAMVTVTEQCIRELDGTGSSLGGLKAGEQLSIYDLLSCLMLASANEAATALANHVTNGDREKFISMMNETAQKLGCVNSHFVNPHGLDHEDQYVTARDVATFLLYAMKFPAFAEIVGKTKCVLPETNLQKERTIHNTNNLLNRAYADYYCEYVKGGKTGTTKNAGNCVAAVASKDGYNYVAVCLKSKMVNIDKDYAQENGAFVDAKTMFEWAFKNIRLVAIADPEKIVTEVNVKYGKSSDYVTLAPAEKVFGLVPTGIDADSLLIQPVEGSVPESVNAPVRKGDVIGKAKVLYAGQVLKEIDLVATTEVRRSFFAFIGSVAKTVFTSWPFRIIAIIVIIILILMYRQKRERTKVNPKAGKDYKILNYKDFINLK